jgi:hypothetical protein
MKRIIEIKEIQNELKYFDFRSFKKWLKYNNYFKEINENLDLKSIWYSFLLFHHGIDIYNNDYFIEFLDLKYVYTNKILDQLIAQDKYFIPDNNFIPDDEIDIIKKSYYKIVYWIDDYIKPSKSNVLVPTSRFKERKEEEIINAKNKLSIRLN